MGKFVIKNAKKGFNFVLKAGNGQVIATSEVYETQKNPQFEIYKDKKGEFRFRLKAKNGEIIAVGEGYTTKVSCNNGIASVQKNAVDAEIVEE